MNAHRDVSAGPSRLIHSEPWPGFSAGLPAIPGGWDVRRFEAAGRSLRLTVPAAPDAFLDDPAVLAANRRDDYMPYWGYLWQAGPPMAAAVLAASWPSGDVLEIGCGIGLVGLAALASGLRVVFSDYDPQSVVLALHNARQNGFDAEGLVLDWRRPIDRRFDIVLGSDVTYEIRNHEPILDVLDAMLASGGVGWIGDAGRQASAAFVPALRRRGHSVEIVDEEGNPLAEPHVGRFQLFRIGRAAGGGSVSVGKSRHHAPRDDRRPRE